MMLHASMLIAQVAIPTNTRVRVPNSEPREHTIDMQTMSVRLNFEPKQGLVKGSVTHVFTPLRKHVDSIIFDAIDITIKEAMLNGKPIRHKNTGNEIIVYPMNMKWNTIDSVTFIYEASPRKGLYFIGWNDTTNRSRKQIWSQGQGIDNRAWIPMYDEMNDKYITETITTFDKQYEVLSNGDLISANENSNGTKTWHYRINKPHAPYLLTLIVGKYAIEKRTSASGINHSLYYYPEFPERVEPTYRFSTEMMDWLEAYIGIPYPWKTYAQAMVQDFTFGAMENTTATTFGDFSFIDNRGFKDRSYIATNVHELVHQWFGDFITARSQQHVWLQESFATFYPKYFFRRYNGPVMPDAKKYFGEDAYQWNRRGEQNSALSAGEKDRLPIVHPSSGSARIYPKGSTVIDMMMYVYGEDEVRRVIKHYLEQHSYGNVETNDLYLAFQDTLGVSPDWFFEQWLYKGGEPHYSVNYSEMTKDNIKNTVFNVEQIHPQDELTKPFAMPIVFEVHYKDGTKDSKTAWIDKSFNTVLVPNSGNKEIAFTLFDPSGNILKRITFNKSFNELREQVLKAPNMIDRYDALVALKEIQDPTKQELLEKVFAKEQFHAMRSEVINQMLQINTPAELAMVRKGLEDPSEDVRKTALNGMRIIPRDLKSAVETLLKDESYAIVTTALEKLSEAFPTDANSYVQTVSNQIGHHAQIRIKALEIRSSKGESSALDSLIDFTGPAFEFWTRRNAMNSLKRINAFNEKALWNILDGAWNPNSRLASNSIETLQYFYQQAEYKTLMINARNSTSEWKSWQKKQWEQIIR
jgi:aminopeptidase N